MYFIYIKRTANFIYFFRHSATDLIIGCWYKKVTKGQTVGRESD